MPAGWKVSRYTYTCDALFPGFHLAYSSRSGALLEFTDEQWVAASALLNGNDEPHTHPLFSDVFNRLVKNLLIVPADENEYAAVLALRASQRVAGPWLSLTIAPTMQCNFRCHYCFEEHRAEFMTPAVVEGLKEFIVRELDRIPKAAGVGITWFGGEPLMAPSVIEEVQRFVNELCRERKLGVSRSIITNAYLLTDEMATRLLGLGDWQLVQITVDGTPLVHDGRRKLVSGKGTYERVTQNALNAARRGLPVSVRVNLDQTNSSTDAIRAMIAEFASRGMTDLIPRMYIGSIVDSTPECSHMADHKLSLREHAKTRLQLHQEFLRLGFASGAQVPKPQCVMCTADSPSGFVIAPKGYVFKCWNEVHLSGDRAVRTVLPTVDPVVARANQAVWDNYDPHAKGECRECKAMPACMGGCPWEVMREEEDHGKCGPFKFFPHKLMQLDHADRMINCANVGRGEDK